MQHRIFTARAMLDRMMECSEEQIAEAAKYGEIHQKHVATRVLESAYTFRQWESSHSQLLRPIVTQNNPRRQVQEVKRMALSLIHRKAPFEFLRDKHVSGGARHRFFREIYGGHDVAKQVVNEHRNYLTSGASYICIERFCSEPSMKELTDYERRYTSYWRAQTERRLKSSLPGEDAPPPELINELRADVLLRRNRLLSNAPKADALTMQELLRPNGDTVRVKFLPSHSAY